MFSFDDEPRHSPSFDRGVVGFKNITPGITEINWSSKATFMSGLVFLEPSLITPPNENFNE